MSNDPFARFEEVFARARASGIELPEACSLATVDKNGRPSNRQVLLKGVDERGFVFYTNTESRKGDDLRANPHASLCFWWSTLQEQVRIDGPAEPVSPEEADAYFATRDRESQIGAWASQQSRPLQSRQALEAAFAEYREKFGDGEVPRPRHWSGYRIIPETIEFWIGRPYRLHDRVLYRKSDNRWIATRLYP